MLMTVRRKEIEQRLGEIVQGRIALHEPVSAHTTLRVGGAADIMVFPETEPELRGVLRLLSRTDLPRFVLGGGADLIVRDGGFRGVCIKLARNFAGSRLIGKGTIEARAGESFPSLLRTARSAELSGFEFLATVPGTVGGGVATNVGAYKQCFADRLESIALLDEGGHAMTIPRDRIRAHYRWIELPIGSVVTSAVFRLATASRGKIEETLTRYASYRRRTQPLREASAGCMFKNPDPEHQAGLLIDRSGLKGLQIGGAAVSELHGNFLINRGGATAADFLNLIDEIRLRVKDRFGFTLETEVRIVGEEPPA